MMRSLSLNFSDHKQRKRQQSNLIVLVLFVIIFIALFVEQARIEQEIVDIEESIARAQGRKTVKQAKPSEQDFRKMNIATAVQQKLNFPWHELLAAIEEVKQQTEHISLMAIQPNPAKGEVIIHAEAPELKTMLDFISLLEKQTVLKDVLLINQHRLDDSNDHDLAFTLKMGWVI